MSRCRRADYVAALKEFAATYPQAMDLVTAEKQHEWTERCEPRPRPRVISHAEADEPRRGRRGGHVPVLVGPRVHRSAHRSHRLTRRRDRVADRLASIATLLATKPAKTAERDFCRRAAVGLGSLGAAAADLDAARSQARTAEAAAAGLASEFASAVDAALEAGRLVGVRRETATEQLDAAGNRRAVAADLAHLYRQRGAELRLAAAVEAEQQAAGAAAQAAAQAAAWRLTQPLAEQADLAAQLDRVRAEASEERRSTAPLRAAVATAAGRLLARLGRLAGEAGARAAAAETEAGRQGGLREGHEQAARKEQDRLTDAAGRSATAGSKLEELAQRRRAAAYEGLLPGSDADPEHECGLAAARLQDRRAEREAVSARRAARPVRRKELGERLYALHADQVRLDADRAGLLTERDRHREQAAALAADPRIRELAEAGETAPVELWAEAGMLSGRLQHELGSADVALIRLEATRLDEQRVLDGQARSGVLPTSLDAARVLAALQERGVEAESGWEHLIGLCPPAKLAEALLDPGLARLGCGVVVPSDRAAEAAAVLNALDTTTTALVGVYPAGAAARLLRPDSPGREPDPGRDPGSAPAWTGLHRGLVDAGTADAAAAAIRDRQARSEDERTALVRGRDADRALLNRLQTLLTACPPGHLETIAGRVAELDAALEQLAASTAAVAAELSELDRAESADAEAQSRLDQAVEELTGTVGTLRALAEACARTGELRLQLETARREQHEAEAEVERQHWLQRRAAAAELDATGTARNELAAANAKRAEAARLAASLDPAPPADPADDDPTVPLDTLQRSHSEAVQALDVRLSTSVLAERERSLGDRLGTLASRLAAAAADVQERAAALLAGPDGQTTEGRATALARAEAVQREADGTVGQARGETAAARREAETLGRRAASQLLTPDPVETPEQAGQLAEEQDRAADEAARAVREAEHRLNALELEEARHAERAKVFGHLLDGLPAPAGPAPAFDGDDAEARRRKQQLTEALTGSRQAVHQTDKALSDAVGAVRAVAGQYPSVRTPARDRVLGDPPDVLAGSAATLGRNLQLRADMIEAELAGIAQDQAIVTLSLAHLVSDTLDTLRKAERYSRLPDSLGTWGGRQMLKIGFDAPAGEAELHAYLDRVIERRVAEGVRPQGLPLLKDAVYEAVGPRGFTVRVLKPTQDVTATSEDITRLGKWSGGEKLTVCVALYCTLAALRARNIGRGNASGGLLMLDNPIGRASHGSLVRLQRDVAAAHGVQLVYTTGVKDPEAVTLFPNVIRLDNRPGRTRNRRYIVRDDVVPAGPVGTGGEVTGTRVAHTEVVAAEELPAEA